MRQTLHSSHGTAFADSPSEWEPGDGTAENGQSARRNAIRAHCRDQLEACVADPRSAMTRRDVEDYMAALREDQLHGPGLHTEEEKTEAVQSLASEHAQRFIRQAQKAGAAALRIIDDAEAKHWIRHASAQEWRRRLKNEQYSWPDRQRFIEKTLPTWQKNWKQIAKDSGEIKNLEKELGITPEAAMKIGDLKEFHKPDFWSGSMKFPQRRAIVYKALAFLRAQRGKKESGSETGTAALYVQAKQQLETAAHNGALADEKVGTWLRRIFQNDAKEEEIRAFVGGKATNSLPVLIRNWTSVRRRYDRIEEKRAAVGTPRSFHFVHHKLFLGKWTYKQREAYVQEAEHRFADLEKERYNILEIRHALDTKDWEGAEEMIREEWRHMKDLTKEDDEKLRSMENFLRTHRPTRAAGKKEKPSNLELVRRFDTLLNAVPEHRTLQLTCCKRNLGAALTKTKLDYNLVWCKEHQWWNPRAQRLKREEAREQTPERVKWGHGRGFEANDITGPGSQMPAIREQKERGEAQWVFAKFNETDSVETVARTCDREQQNRRFWYYTSEIDENVSYGKTEYLVKVVQPQLKSVIRELNNRGILQETAKMLLGEKKQEADYALAA